MMINRCPRCLKDELYMDYHDNEWGKPVHDDAKHFEFLVLETFQAGLSWYTVLKKREAFRNAFANFDPKLVALFDNSKVDLLMQDVGIIRNRAKIQATIINAQIFLQIQKQYGSWDAFIWKYTDNQIIINNISDYKQCLACSALSDQISKDLKKMGMKFVGSTVVYAHLQATGQINDHENKCWKK